MAWLYVVIAGVLEVVWAVELKYTEGFTHLWPSILTAVAMLGSVVLLEASLKAIPIGTAYAVWTGIGAAGTAVIGMVFLGEPRDIGRVLCVSLIIMGVIGLKIQFPEQ